MGFMTAVFEVLDFDPSVQKARKLEWDGDLDGAIRSLEATIRPRVHRRCGWTSWDGCTWRRASRRKH